MQKRRILIGSPISQNPGILQAFLHSIARLQLPECEVHYHFVDDNHKQISSHILSSFQEHNPNVMIERGSDEAQLYQNHKWNQDMIWKVAEYKERMIERARREDFDYLFLVDSDLLLHPLTVSQLIESDKEIVCEVFWTKWTDVSCEQPQVWLSDFYNQYEAQIGEKLTKEEELRRTIAFFSMLRKPGLYEVGGLGACTLIARSALEKGVSFRQVKNLSFWGEDRHFCVRASVLGIEMFVDTNYPAYHVFREAELPAGIEFLNLSALNGAGGD